MVEALSLGANDYVTKPIDFQVALARIETHLAHKRAVEDLRDSEERYALAVNGANDGLCDWNVMSGPGLLVAAVAIDPGPRDRARSAPNPNEWLMRVHPEDRRASCKPRCKDHLAHGTGHFESEHRVRHRDDTYRWVRCRGAAVQKPRRAWRRASPVRSPTSPKPSWPTR